MILAGSQRPALQLPVSSLHLPLALLAPENINWDEGLFFQWPSTLPVPTPGGTLSMRVSLHAAWKGSCSFSHCSYAQVRREDGIRPDFQDTCHFKNDRQGPKGKFRAPRGAQHRACAASTVTLDYFTWGPGHTSTPAGATRLSSSHANSSPSLMTLGFIGLLPAIFFSLRALSVPKYSHR